MFSTKFTMKAFTSAILHGRRKGTIQKVPSTENSEANSPEDLQKTTVLPRLEQRRIQNRAHNEDQMSSRNLTTIYSSKVSGSSTSVVQNGRRKGSIQKVPLAEVSSEAVRRIQNRAHNVYHLKRSSRNLTTIYSSKVSGASRSVVQNGRRKATIQKVPLAEVNSEANSPEDLQETTVLPRLEQRRIQSSAAFGSIVQHGRRKGTVQNVPSAEVTGEVNPPVNLNGQEWRQTQDNVNGVDNEKEFSKEAAKTWPIYKKKRKDAAKMQPRRASVTDFTSQFFLDASPQQLFDLPPPSSTESTLPLTLETADEQQLEVNTDGEERAGVPRAGRRTDRVPISRSRSRASQHCKNYTFSNDEMQRIENENQRLLRKLLRTSARSSPRITHPFLLSHSGINRQHAQQRIQQENLVFLKGLESVKATPGMTRLEQLIDYQRQAGYLGIPTPPIGPISGRTARNSSSASRHRTRPATSKLQY